jgi:hypothetical protein
VGRLDEGGERKEGKGEHPLNAVTQEGKNEETGPEERDCAQSTRAKESPRTSILGDGDWSRENQRGETQKLLCEGVQRKVLETEEGEDGDW